MQLGIIFPVVWFLNVHAMTDPVLFEERYVRYIQEALKVSRQDVLETIRISRTSAERIAKFIKKSKSNRQRVQFA